MSLKYFPYAAGQLQICGLSSDTKPTSPTEGWTFLEEDTGKTFRAESNVWVEKINATYSQGSHNHSGVYAPVLGSDDNYVTDAEKVKLGNLSGTNTGDQTAASLGLGNVSNTSDANKPVSTATQTALDAKLDDTQFSGLAKISVGTVEPTSPSAGDLWVDTN